MPDAAGRSGLPAIADYPAFLEAWAAKAREPREPGAPTVFSTFAGCGGSSLGYLMAGFREALATDWDARACASFRLNFPDTPLWEGDIAGLTAADALAAAGVAEGGLDVLDGSPPCQGFSTAGKRRVTDGRNTLFREFARLLRGMRPRAFVMENVRGLVMGKMRPVFRETTSELSACGYDVVCRLVDAKWLGVPQERKRLIWVGIRADLGLEPRHPVPLWEPPSVLDAIGDLMGAADAVASGMVPTRPRDANAPSPAVGASGGYAYRLGGGGVSVAASGGQELAVRRGSGHDDRARGLDKPGYAIRATGESPTIGPVTERREVVIRNPMHRNAWKGAGGPAPAVVGQSSMDVSVRDGTEPLPFDDRHAGMRGDAPPGGDASDATGVGGFATVAHWEERRALTVAEAKRLQSFPDGFALVGSYAQRWRQVGNAVPPMMMRAIAEAVREALGCAT